MSHAYVDAWDEFRKKSPDMFDARSLGAPPNASYYLANRLDAAFRAGVEAGERIERERIAKKLADLTT